MNITTIILVLLVYFTLWYIVAQIMNNAGIIDIGWGSGFVLLAILQQLSTGFDSGWLLTAMVFVWGVRLSWHIAKRNLGKPEDFRYANFRREWGSTYLVRSYFQLFLFQGLLMGIISVAHLMGQTQEGQLFTPLAIVGVFIYLLGFSIEAIGDAQLKAHVSNPKNRGTLIRTGLWKYSRHPNYFGEAVLWWGIYLVAVAYGAPWWTFFSPLTITLLVRYVSGVPMLEKRMEKYPDFESYRKSTSIFALWFNKKGD
jgi:steroid 5-alpha reductase family enzyme